jgi:Flp pilus assembly protein TadG
VALVFNIALGKVKYYAELPAANDGLIAVPIETTGIVSDATMRDYADLSTLLAGASNEQTTMGRKTLASVTVTVDNTNDRVSVDCADITWTAATGNAISAIVICYDPDTTTGTDSDLIPLVKCDFPITPDGSDVTATVNDFYRSTSAA